MATCPECDADINLDEFDVDAGDTVSCEECGTNLVITRLSPLDLEVADEEDDEESEEDDEEDEEAGDDYDDGYGRDDEDEFD